MGGSLSGQLVDEAFFNQNNKRNFLANMEQIDPKTAKSVTEKLENSVGDVSRFVLMTTGESESLSCWQTKHLFVCSWVVKKLPIEPFQFVKHIYQKVSFVSVHIDACAYDYMKYFMDLAMYFLSKSEFVKKVTELAQYYDKSLQSYFTSPFKPPKVTRPTFSIAKPSKYAIEQVSSPIILQERPDDEEPEEIIIINSEDEGVFDEEIQSVTSEKLPQRFIPDLVEMEISESETSFMSAVSEDVESIYSDSNKKIGQSSESSVFGIVSESELSSNVPSAFVLPPTFTHHSNVESESDLPIFESSESEAPVNRNVTREKIQKPRQRKVGLGRGNFDKDKKPDPVKKSPPSISIDDEDTKSGTFFDSNDESDQGPVSDRKPKQIEKPKASIALPPTKRSQPKPIGLDIDIEALDFSAGILAPDDHFENMDSIILDDEPIKQKIPNAEPSIKSREIPSMHTFNASDSSNNDEQNSYSSNNEPKSGFDFRAKRNLPRPSQKVRKVPQLPPQEYLFLTDSEDEDSMKPRSRVISQSNDYSTQQNLKKPIRSRRKINPNSDIPLPMSSDNPDVLNIHSDIINISDNEEIESKTNDTKPVTVSSLSNGTIQSGKSIIHTGQFNEFLGTGTFSSSARRAPNAKNIPSEAAIQTDSIDSIDDDFGSSNFDTDKFIQFPKEKNRSIQKTISDDETIPSNTFGSTYTKKRTRLPRKSQMSTSSEAFSDL